jgi:hypothetical protein
MREFEEEIREGMQSHRAVLAEVGEVSSLDYKSMTTLLLQAVPLTPLEPEWPIHTERRRILRPLERSHAGLAWGLAPPRRLTMSGMELRGHVGSSRSPTLLAFHCTGQVAATLTVRSSCQGRDGQDKRVLEQEQVELILKYLEVCDLALEAMETDVPYLLQCKILEANGLFLEWSNVPYRRTELRWPIVVRDAGHSFTELYRDLRDRLYFAFDLELSK